STQRWPTDVGRCRAATPRSTQPQSTETRAGGNKGALPKALRRLQMILRRGLDATASLWPDVRVAYGWVHRAAHILNNDAQSTEAAVKRRLHGLLGAMGQH